MAIHIDAYRFSEMVISGTPYHRDLKILGDKIVPDWWRKQGHSLCLDDIKDVLRYSPEVLVVGTGAYGVMKVPESLIRDLEKRGLKVECYSTAKAVERFNELVEAGKKVAGAFHLTC